MKSIRLMLLLIVPVALCGCAREPNAGDKAKTATATRNVQAEIKTAAEACTTAFARKDFSTVADYTYEPVIKLMGGKEAAIAVIEAQIKDLEDKGMTIVSITAADPEPVTNIENLQFSIVPTKIKLKLENTTMQGEEFMIAVSNDGGKVWKFVDGAAATDQDMMKEVFGDAAGKLRLPAPKEPIVVDDKP